MTSMRLARYLRTKWVWPRRTVFDLALTNPSIRAGRLFRGAADLEKRLDPRWLVVELRTDSEVRSRDRSPCDATRRLCVPLDVPSEGCRTLTRMEHAYLQWCASSSRIFPPILDAANAGHILFIRCQQGIDRTGFVCALLHMLLGTPREAIVEEYLKCGNEMTRVHHLELCLEAVHSAGGVDAHFDAAGCSSSAIAMFRSTLQGLPSSSTENPSMWLGLDRHHGGSST